LHHLLHLGLQASLTIECVLLLNLLLVLRRKLVKVLLNRSLLPQVRLFPLLHLLVSLPRAPTR
jgi:hypothetical protein